jgi:Kef-type K+ transport system membrane component KefB
MLNSLLHHSTVSDLLLYLIVTLVAAILAISINKLKQPAVLGQILVGSFIAVLTHYNISFFKQLTTNHTLEFFAQLGSIFLLFEIGLESDIKEIKKSGTQAIIVALTGVIVPFISGFYILAPLISPTPSISFALFIASILAVTSTGISVSVFKDMGIIKQKSCQIVLSASIIDDIMGLILLSVISALISVGHVDISHIALILLCVAIFFSLSIILGKFVLPITIDKLTSKISLGDEMLTLTLVVFCLFLAWCADLIGLASIIGAFMAGLLIKEKYFAKYTYFRRKSTLELPYPDNNHHLIMLIAPLGRIMTPIFFIYAGMQIDIVSAMNIETIKLALLISIFAVLSKVVCGIFLPKHINRWIVGFGMVPRGEIGVIFALTGLQLQLINNTMFTAILLMIIITSVITPLMINRISQPKKLIV